jgi:hypothetical protein
MDDDTYGGEGQGSMDGDTGGGGGGGGSMEYGDSCGGDEGGGVRLDVDAGSYTFGGEARGRGGGPCGGVEDVDGSAYELDGV